MQIFVVEDEDQARKGLIQLIRQLTPHNPVVGQALDGREALRRILRLKPDLVFTDIRIPWMDGLELISSVYAHGLNPEFVIISAHADFKYAKSAIALNVAEYLVKPVLPEELANALRNAESRHGERVGRAVTASPLCSTTHSSAPCFPLPLPAIPQPDDRVHPAVRKALALIEKGFTGILSQESISNEVRVTPEYLSQLFNRSMGVSFSAYLRRIRIRNACLLFGESDLRIQQVAEAVGYPDPKYFCRVFREMTGQTPSEYQQTLRLSGWTDRASPERS